MNNPDIWVRASEGAETFAQRMSVGTYGYFCHGLYIFGMALLLCQLASRGRSTNPAINWFLLVTSFILGPRIPILDPESAVLKVMIFLSGATVIVLAPRRLSLFLSSNERQRRKIQIALVAMLIVVFVGDQLSRRCL